MAKPKCSAKTNKGRKCKRTVKRKGDLCGQHKAIYESKKQNLVNKKEKKTNYGVKLNSKKDLKKPVNPSIWSRYHRVIIPIVCFLIMLVFGIWNRYNPYKIENQKDKYTPSEINTCNRFSNQGCTLDLSTITNPHEVHFTKKLLAKGKRPYKTASIEAGGIMTFYEGIENKWFNFPGIKNKENILSPFQFTIEGTKLIIKGNLEDYDSDTPLGWFDGNEFKIFNNSTGGCAYSVNKDELGIEIVNINQEVCFSLNLCGNWKFQGYFKDQFDNIHIFNDSHHMTKDPKIAKREIRKISAIFDHRSLSDSLGQRIIPLNDCQPLWKLDATVGDGD